jgi:hypothetical protein
MGERLLLVFGGVNAIETERPRHVRSAPTAAEQRASRHFAFVPQADSSGTVGIAGLLFNNLVGLRSGIGTNFETA